MTGQDDPATFQRLVERIRPGGRLIGSRPLEGGVSAHVTAVEVALPDGRTERVVVRRHGAIDKGHNPEIAQDEYRLLQTLHAAGLTVPAPVYLDVDGAFFDAPCLVMEFVEGSASFALGDVPDMLGKMATCLAKVHGLGLDPDRLGVLPRRDDPAGSVLELLLPGAQGERIAAALASRAPFSSTNGSVLLHGDFWPGNILWRDGRIAAVLDWEDAAIGDPLADLAGSRQELLWIFGERAMEEFTDHYTAIRDIDLTNLPYWELYVATGALAHMAGWGLDADTLADMRRKTTWFIDRALDVLASR